MLGNYEVVAVTQAVLSFLAKLLPLRKWDCIKAAENSGPRDPLSLIVIGQFGNQRTTHRAIS